MTPFMRMEQAEVRIGPVEADYRLLIEDFDIELGQIAMVAGPSGSGKSLFLEMAGLVRRPEHAACFTISGRESGGKLVNIADLWSVDDLAALARMRTRTLGFMVPSSLLASHTVRQNLTLSSKVADVSPEIGLDWAKRLGLEGLLDRLPSDLSFGQRHRAVLARALASDPDCLIADEPTGPLDIENSEVLAQCLAEFAFEQNRAVILASHEEPLFRSIAAQSYRVVAETASKAKRARLVREDG